VAVLVVTEILATLGLPVLLVQVELELEDLAQLPPTAQMELDNLLLLTQVRVAAVVVEHSMSQLVVLVAQVVREL
jgi:hypothetical protein